MAGDKRADGFKPVVIRDTALALRLLGGARVRADKAAGSIEVWTVDEHNKTQRHTWPIDPEAWNQKGREGEGGPKKEAA